MVDKVDPTISANTTGIKLGENAIINVTVDDDATGTVTIKVAGIEQTVAVTGGVNSIIVPDVPVGDHTVEVIYNGDDKYSGKSTTTELVVSPKDTNPGDIRVIDNGDGTVTVIVPDNATGNVTVKIGNETIPAEELVDGKAIVNLTKSNATPGVHNITVIYSGDGNHTPAEVNATGTIPKWDSEISASVSTIREGDDAIITVEVKPKDATGTVRVEVNGTGYYADIKDGVATVVVPGLKEGTHDIKVTYDGDDTYNGDNTTAQITVQAPIKVGVNGTGNSSQVVIELPTNDTAGSNITVKIDGVERNFTVENGTVKANLTGLEPGEHNMTVIYTDENNVTSVVETKIIVPKWSSEVSASAPKIREGDDLPITVTVGPDMTGRVLVDLNGTGYYADIKDGKATIIAPGIKAGKYAANVTYLGNDKYDPANNTFEVIVEAPITIEIDGNGNNSQVVIKLPENGTDDVKVTIDGKDVPVDVSNNTAIGNLTDFEPGEHNITVIYTDANGTQSIVNKTITVPRWDSSVEATAATIREGDDANIVVTVGGKDMTGLIRVDIDGIGYYANITNGTVTIQAPGLKAGKYVANVTYDGNGKYDPANNTFTLVVEPPITITVEGAGNSTKVIVDLPENGTNDVVVMVDGKEIPANVSDGKAVVNLNNITAGDHNITVVYTDQNGTKSVVNQTIVVYKSIKANDMKRGWNSPYDYEAEFLDKDGHVIADTVMQYTINGTTYEVKTDSKGIAKLTTSHLDVGEYEVQITNTVTHEVLTKNLTIVKRLIENKDIVMEFVDGTSYTVTAIGDDGNPVTKGEVVGIKVNSRDYVAITDDDGVAKLLINLNPAKYTITAEYAKYKVSNSLVVKQTLKLVKKTITVKKSTKSLKLKATLKWESGKAISGKQITFKFYGKTYKVKTNSKGLAQVTIKNSILKKLKSGKGKKFAYSATYKTNKVKGTVKVKK